MSDTEAGLWIEIALDAFENSSDYDVAGLVNDARVELAQFKALVEAATALNWRLDPTACACLGPAGDCPCIRSWNEARATFRVALEAVTMS